MTRSTAAVTPAHGRRLRLAAALAVIAVIAGACGLPYDPSPQTLSGELPQELSNPPPTVTTTTQPRCHPNPKQCAYAQLFYVQIDPRSSQPELVQLPPQPLPPPPSIAGVLKALQSGPPISAAATQQGPVTNDLPVGSDLQSLGLPVHGVAHISADSIFYDQQSVQAELEFGQIVYTLTQTKALRVTAVQFYFGGSVASVVNASGQVVTGTIDQSDYCAETKAGCPAPKSTTTTTPSK